MDTERNDNSLKTRITIIVVMALFVCTLVSVIVMIKMKRSSMLSNDELLVDQWNQTLKIQESDNIFEVKELLKENGVVSAFAPEQLDKCFAWSEQENKIYLLDNDDEKVSTRGWYVLNDEYYQLLTEVVDVRRSMNLAVVKGGSTIKLRIEPLNGYSVPQTIEVNGAKFVWDPDKGLLTVKEITNDVNVYIVLQQNVGSVIDIGDPDIEKIETKIQVEDERKEQAVCVTPTVLQISTNTIVLKNIETAGYGTVLYNINTTDSVPKTNWQTGCEFTGLQAGCTYYLYAKYAGDLKYRESSASNALVITMPKLEQPIDKPEAESVTSNSIVIKSVTGIGKVEYAISEENKAPTEGWTDSNIFTNLKPGKTYYCFVRFGGDESHNAVISEAQVISTRVNAESVFVEPKIKEVRCDAIYLENINGLGYGNAEYAISTNYTTPSKGWTTAQEFLGLAPNTNYFIFVRFNYRSEKVSSVSGCVKVKTDEAKEKEKAPEKLIAEKIGGNSITLSVIPENSKTTLEYAISLEKEIPKDGWQKENTFENLKPDTCYYCFARYMAYENYPESEPCMIDVRTKKEEYFIPSAPSIVKMNGDMVAVSSGSIPDYCIAEYNISKDNKEPTEGWTKNNVFVGLNKGTTYYIFVRCFNEKTGTYSDVSQPLTYTIKMVQDTNPQPVKDVKSEGSTLIIIPGEYGKGVGELEYAISTADTEELNGWTTSTVIKNLKPDTTYFVYVRYSGNNEYYPSKPSEPFKVHTES